MGQWTSFECSNSCGGGLRVFKREVVSGGQDCFNNQELLKTEPCNQQICPHFFAASLTGWICFSLVTVLLCFACFWMKKKGFVVKNQDLPLITFGEVSKVEKDVFDNDNTDLENKT